jgi:hypothetical protein
VNEYYRSGSIKGIKIGRFLALFHFLIMDDVSMFENGTLQEALIYKKKYWICIVKLLGWKSRFKNT